MKPTNQIVNQQDGNRKSSFSQIINQQGTRAMIDKSIGDPQRAANFVATLISAVNTNVKLKECDAGSVISAALRGEIGLGLSLALGEYALVPYAQNCAFQIQTNGLKQLCVRSGQYSKIGFFDVRKGEYLGRDPLTREPNFKWIEDDNEREKLEIVGYYGFYQLKDTGFFQSIYWTHEQILKHADRYSQAFSYDKYMKILNGELTESEVKKLQQGSPWYGLPTDMPHIKMCMKTIAKQLLNDGLAPKKVIEVINQDNFQEKSGEAAVFADGIQFTDSTPEVKEAEKYDGEVIDVPEEDIKTVDEPKNKSVENVSNGNKENIPQENKTSSKAKIEPQNAGEENADTEGQQDFFA